MTPATEVPWAQPFSLSGEKTSSRFPALEFPSTFSPLSMSARSRFFPEAGPHHRPEELLLFEADAPNHWEPVAEGDLDTKVAALLEHRSQWRSTMGIEPGGPDEAAQLAAFRGEVRRRAEAGAASRPGAGAGELAEAFTRIDRT